jgi:hypothetical protein
MSELRRQLADALSASGYSVKPDENRLTPLAEKLDFLQKTNRYSRLISGLLDANNRANLRSLVLEVTFAFQFETAGMPLQYEVRQRPNDETSVDFRRQAESGKQLCIEMRLVQQRQVLTNLFEQQLRESDYFGTVLDDVDDRAETLRLQRLVLEKAVNSRGELIKFQPDSANSHNIIAIEVSELHLGMIDANDCLLACYGDPAVNALMRRHLFGLFQEPSQEYPRHIRDVAERFAPFRKTVHAVLFLRKVPPASPINYCLEYLIVHNRKLMTSDEVKNIACDISKAMAVWRSIRRA